MPLLVWLLLGLSTNLSAQVAPPPRFAAPHPPAASVERADTTPSAARRPLPDSFVFEQGAVAGGGMAVGMLVGGLAGLTFAKATMEPNAGGLEGLFPMLAGMIIGGPIGAAIAVDRFSRPRGITSSRWAAMAGGYLGWIGGPAFFVTIPLGTVTAYNLARR